MVTKDGGRPSIVWSDTLRTSAGLAASARLRLLYQGVRDAIALHQPASMAIERLMWGRNTQSAMEVARASGVILLAAAEAGLVVEEYAPLEVKMAVTGVGNASKEQVRRGLGLLLGASAVPSDPDSADAVAVAVCHLHQSRLRRLSRDAVR